MAMKTITKKKIRYINWQINELRADIDKLKQISMDNAQLKGSCEIDIDLKQDEILELVRQRGIEEQIHIAELKYYEG